MAGNAELISAPKIMPNLINWGQCVQIINHNRFEFRLPDSKLEIRNSCDNPIAWTVEPDRVTFSQFRVSLIDPFSRSIIWSPEKFVAKIASIGSTAVNPVKIVDFFLSDQFKKVILQPWAAWTEPKGVVAITDGESRPLRGKVRDFSRLNASK